jgi:hypothetical protein
MGGCNVQIAGFKLFGVLSFTCMLDCRIGLDHSGIEPAEYVAQHHRDLDFRPGSLSGIYFYRPEDLQETA